ncbi:hypothetical protein RHSIM_Rhsim02G0194800 [Rhododendron simsii]|uniref:Uncharacterized protein n=1 Tax=Rhododendron simsii TaxID=118357 RepID=A0A834HBG7_RHOSS|nr:hypothetical protein RHSIM_Rhsim02G0194800 [Rhododendron simsii]
MQSARNSSRMLEESYATGVAILAPYAGQRDHLKGTHGLLGFGSRSEERQGLGMAVAISICGFGLRLSAIMQCKVNRGLVQDAHHLAIPARANPAN